LATIEDLNAWIERTLDLTADQKSGLLAAVGEVFDRQRRLWQDSKLEAIQALSTAFADKLAAARDELLRRDATVANITRYFEEVVAELSEKAHRDPKTKLLNYDWFMERIESFLAVEQRVRWSALGVVDLAGFKWVNDNLGHAVGDRVISRVAQILNEHLRSEDLLSDRGAERGRGLLDLHARFGGDEFSFFIPDLSRPEDARTIATRFKSKLESHPWHHEHLSLLEHPVRVDVGVVCVLLGSLAERRGATHTLAEELVQWADRLMYRAKNAGAAKVDMEVARIAAGRLVAIGTSDVHPVPPRNPLYESL
jgi:diguanylate cyclase (GGDEF)-like protein